MGLTTVTTTGATPLTFDAYRLGSNSKTILKTSQGSNDQLIYTVPDGKIFTGYVSNNGHNEFSFRLNGDTTTTDFKLIGHTTYSTTVYRLAVVLHAGDKFYTSDSSYHYSIFGVESDA